MSQGRPSILRRILNRVYPFPLVCAQENRLASQEQRIHDLGNALQQLREQVEANRSHILKKVDASRWHLRDYLESQKPAPGELSCILCGHKAPTSELKTHVTECIFGGGRLVRHECRNCGAIFGPQKILNLTPEELSFEYKELYGYYKESDSTESEIRAFRSLRPRKDGIYLNYGAGAWSHSNDQLRKEGYKVYAYEPYVDTPSEFIITSEDQLRKMRFDGIYSNNVIEHFDTPVKAFQLMASVLKGPDSRMAHASPCYDYLCEFTRFHLIFYTGQSTEVLAKLSGLRTDGKERDDSKEAVFICHQFRPL